MKSLIDRIGYSTSWLLVIIVVILLLFGVGTLSYWCGSGRLQVSFERKAICTTHSPPGGVAAPGEVTISQVQDVAKLVSVEAHLITDVHYTSYANTPGWLRSALSGLGVRDEIVVLTYGTVVAGFDLEELTEDRYWVDGTRVQLQLPRPKFLYRPNIDNQRTRIIYHSDKCPDIICTDSVEIATGQVLVEAEERMLAAGEESKVLDRAAESGRQYFETFFESLGYEEVRILVDGYKNPPSTTQ